MAETKSKYREFQEIIERNFEYSLLLTLLLSIILFLTFEKFPEREIKMRKVDKITTYEIPPEVKQMEKIKAPPRPSIPIETESEDVPEDVTIAETVIDTIWKPPPEIEETVYFIAYDEAPELINQSFVEPEYPEMARKAQIEGQAVVILYIDEKGNVDRVDIIKTPMEGVFDKSLRDAMLQWKFKPAFQRDKPVPVKMGYTFIFSLKG
jgi:protein TonB